MRKGEGASSRSKYTYVIRGEFNAWYMVRAGMPYAFADAFLFHSNEVLNGDLN
jgi:hypothetical protein